MDQALFVTLALIAIGSVSNLHTELMQWNKYVCILYGSEIEKLVNRIGLEKVKDWCNENHLELSIKTEIEPIILKKNPTKPVIEAIESKSQPIPSKHKSSSKNLSFKKSKTSKGTGNEIDDIFNSL